jgi:hypothetical protein
MLFVRSESVKLRGAISVLQLLQRPFHGANDRNTKNGSPVQKAGFGRNRLIPSDGVYQLGQRRILRPQLWLAEQLRLSLEFLATQTPGPSPWETHTILWVSSPS